jgi:putative tryptophan/tyrosine transport system substrate-binding protein
MTFFLRRREFIAALGGAAAVWPLAARAQQGDRVRRIGFLWSLLSPDASQAIATVFAQGLEEHGWGVGKNLRIDHRWALGDPDRLRRSAEELATLAPDALVAGGGSAATALQQATRTLPIVFGNVPDPVGAGFVESLARPGGNMTGFMSIEYSQSAKWLELLKQIAPQVKRVAILRAVVGGAGPAQFAAIQAVAPLFGVEVIPVNARGSAEIERAVTEFARAPNGGLIVTVGVGAPGIVALAARHRLPAVYSGRGSAVGGGLISYGPDTLDMYRRSASYVDRVLRGERPADLPAQAPTKYELVLNLKTARALGLDVPATVYARADEVIE